MALLALLAAAPAVAQSEVKGAGTKSSVVRKSSNTGVKTKKTYPKGVNTDSKEWSAWQEQISIRWKDAVRELKYPEEAVQRKEEGLVVVSFSVKTDGSVGKVKIVKNATPLLDAEAVRMVKSTSGKWSPMTQNGKPVDAKIVWPVKFKLDK